MNNVNNEYLTRLTINLKTNLMAGSVFYSIPIIGQQHACRTGLLW